MVHFVTVSLNSILDHHHLAFRVGRQQKGLSLNLRRQPAYQQLKGFDPWFSLKRKIMVSELTKTRTPLCIANFSCL